MTALTFFHFLSIHRSCRISQGPHQSACYYYECSLHYHGRSLHFSALFKAFLLEVSGIASRKKQHLEMFTVPCTNQEETWDQFSGGGDVPNLIITPKHCFLVERGNKTELILLRDNSTVITWLFRYCEGCFFSSFFLLISFLYPGKSFTFCQLRQQTERFLKRNRFCRQELTYGAWDLFNHQGHLFHRVPYPNSERKSSS